MTEDVRRKAEASLKDVEAVTATVLPEPSMALVPLKDADAPVAAEISKRMEEIDMGDSNSIIVAEK